MNFASSPPANDSIALARMPSTAAPRFCFTLIAIASASSAPTSARTASSTPSGATRTAASFLTRPTSLAQASMSLHALATASWPFSTA